MAHIVNRDDKSPTFKAITFLSTFVLTQYFACFSVSARRELARVLGFETYEDGRTIIKEGQKGTSMYFIISGSVSVSVSLFACVFVCLFSTSAFQ